MPQTLLEKRKYVADKRSARIRAGLCTACGLKPAALNSRGEMGRKCSGCRERDRAAHSPVKVRGMNDKVLFGDTEMPTYLDSREYAAYGDQVLKVIRKLGRPTVADLKRGLGERLNDRWLMDALGSLEAGRKVERVQAGALGRWVVV